MRLTPNLIEKRTSFQVTNWLSVVIADLEDDGVASPKVAFAGNQSNIRSVEGGICGLDNDVCSMLEGAEGESLQLTCQCDQEQGLQPRRQQRLRRGQERRSSLLVAEML